MTANSNFHPEAYRELDWVKRAAKDHKTALSRRAKEATGAAEELITCLKEIREQGRQYAKIYYQNLALELLPEVSNTFKELTKTCMFLEMIKGRARHMLTKLAKSELGACGAFFNSDQYEIVRGISDMLYRIEAKCDDLLFMRFLQLDGLKRKVEAGVDLLSDPDGAAALTSEKTEQIQNNKKIDILSKEIALVCLKYIAEIEGIDENATEKKLDNAQTPID